MERSTTSQPSIGLSQLEVQAQERRRSQETSSSVIRSLELSPSNSLCLQPPARHQRSHSAETFYLNPLDTVHMGGVSPERSKTFEMGDLTHQIQNARAEPVYAPSWLESPPRPGSGRRHIQLPSQSIALSKDGNNNMSSSVLGVNDSFFLSG